MKKAVLLCSLAVLLGVGHEAAAQTASSGAEVPVFEITPVESKIKFDVEASVAIEGTFSKWDATLSGHD